MKVGLPPSTDDILGMSSELISNIVYDVCEIHFGVAHGDEWIMVVRRLKFMMVGGLGLLVVVPGQVII